MDGIYHIYTMDIPWIYHQYTWICYVYRPIHKIPINILHGIYQPYLSGHNMDGIYHMYTMDIPWIYYEYTCIWNVYRHIPKIQPGHHVLSSIISIYHGYTMHIQDIHMYIPNIYMYILIIDICIYCLKYFDIRTKIFWYTD